MGSGGISEDVGEALRDVYAILTAASTLGYASSSNSPLISTGIPCGSSAMPTAVRATGVLAGLRPKQLVEKIRRSVDHLGHPVETGFDIAHAEQTHDAFDAVEIAKLPLEARQHGKRCRSRRRITFLHADVAPKLALGLDARADEISSVTGDKHD